MNRPLTAPGFPGSVLPTNRRILKRRWRARRYWAIILVGIGITTYPMMRLLGATNGQLLAIGALLVVLSYIILWWGFGLTHWARLFLLKVRLGLGNNEGVLRDSNLILRSGLPFPQKVAADFFRMAAAAEFSCHQFDRARTFLRIANHLFVCLDDPLESMLTSLDMAIVELRAGRLIESTTHFERLLTLTESASLPNHTAAASVNAHAGMACVQAGYASPALRHFDQALVKITNGSGQWSSSNRFRFELAMALISIAEYVYQNFSVDHALERLSQAEPVVASLTKSNVLQGRVALLKAQCLESLGSIDQASATYELAIEHLDGHFDSLIDSCLHLARLCWVGGDHDSTKSFLESIDIFQQTEEQKVKLKVSQWCREQTALINDYTRLPPSQFIEIRSDEEVLRSIRPSAGHTGLDRSLRDARLRFLRAAVGIVPPQQITGNQELEDEIEALKQEEDWIFLSESVLELARLAMVKEELEAATQYSELAIEAAQNSLIGVNEESVRSRRSTALLEAAELSFMANSLRGNDERSLAAFDSVRSLGLVRCLRAKEARRLLNSLFSIDNTVAHNAGAADQYTMLRLGEAASFLRSGVTQDEEPELLHKQIPNEALFLGYHVGCYGTLLVSADNVAVRTTVLTQTNSDSMNSEDRDFGWQTRSTLLSSFDNPNLPMEHWVTQGKQWAEALLPGDILSMLDSHRKICVAPDSDLWKVPFACLCLPSGKFLGFETLLVHSTSLSGCFLQKARHLDIENVLLVGKSNFGADRVALERASPADHQLEALSNLPYAVEEVLNLAELYQTIPLINEEARRDLVIEAMGQSDIIHIASHAFLSDADPMASGIVLSGDTCVLTAQDILGIEMRAQLVVLSGCRTARGRLRPGDGLLGLCYALKRAGAQTILGSLWEVNDASTSQFMKTFHEAYITDQDASRALQFAQTKLHQEGYTPYHWAPFIVYQ